MKHTLMTLAAALTLVFTGCGSESSNIEGQVSPPEHSEEEVALHVLAAASLQKSFEEISEEFTADNPHVTVEMSFAGSSTLVQNLEAGAPADVFASADEVNMDKAEEADLIDVQTSEVFAANKLVGIVPADNPANVSTLADANEDGVNLVICAPQVPCGALSERVAQHAGVMLHPVSEEQQVSDVLGKVRSGQADAGLVYATDAALAPDEVETFDIESAADTLNYYPIARTSNSASPETATAFVEFVQSDAGQSILQAHGFTAP